MHVFIMKVMELDSTVKRKLKLNLPFFKFNWYLLHLKPNCCKDKMHKLI